MIVTIRNLTDEHIIAETHPTSSKLGVKSKRTKTWQLPSNLVLQPSCRLTTRLPKGELILHAHSCTSDVSNLSFSDEKTPILEEGWFFDPASLKISLSTIFTKSWNVVPVPHGSKWRIFSLKVRSYFLYSKVIRERDKRYYRQVARRYHQIVILHRRNLASFLSDMPDHLPLSSLLLPGV